MKQALWLLTITQLLAGTTIFAAQVPEEKDFEDKLAAVVPSERQYAWQRRHGVNAFVHFLLNFSFLQYVRFFPGHRHY